MMQRLRAQGEWTPAPRSAGSRGWMERQSCDSRLSRFPPTQLPPINLRCARLGAQPVSGGRAARLLESGSTDPGQDRSDAAGTRGNKALCPGCVSSSAEPWVPCRRSQHMPLALQLPTQPWLGMETQSLPPGVGGGDGQSAGNHTQLLSLG